MMLWCLRCNREPDDNCDYCDFKGSCVEIPEYDEEEEEDE